MQPNASPGGATQVDEPAAVAGGRELYREQLQDGFGIVLRSDADIEVELPARAEIDLAGVVTLGLWSTSSWQLLPRSRFLDELGLVKKK